MTQPVVPAQSPALTAVPAAVNAQATPPVQGIANPERPSADQRAEAIRARLAAEDGGASEPVVETSTQPAEGGSTPATDSAASASPEDRARQERAAARMRRIQESRDAERAADAKRQREERTRVTTSELETLRKRIAELEPNEAVWKSEADLLEAAEKRGMSSQKLVEYMRQRLTDPQAIAQQQSRSVAEEMRAEIRRVQEEAKAEVERLRAEQEAEREARRSQDDAGTFLRLVEAHAADYPRTAALKARHGDAGLVHFANTFIVPLLPDGYSFQQLHDHMEQLLDELQVSGASAPQPATPAPGQSHTPPRRSGAEQPVTTLGSLPSERTAVVEEIPLHKLSKLERVQRLKEKLARED